MCDSVECLLDKARFTNPCASQHSQDVRALVSADAAEGVDEQTDFSFPADEWCLNSRAPVKAGDGAAGTDYRERVDRLDLALGNDRMADLVLDSSPAQLLSE